MSPLSFTSIGILGALSFDEVKVSFDASWSNGRARLDFLIRDYFGIVLHAAPSKLLPILYPRWNSL